MPRSISDDFAQAYDVKVRYVVYETQQEAMTQMKAGAAYDLVVMNNSNLSKLIQDGFLASIDFQNVLNFKNVSPNFRDLLFDPGNEHSVPIEWGITGIIVRTDRVSRPITRWADLWDPAFAGKVGVWGIERDVIGFTLKSLGYSLNSEDPRELAAAQKRLLALKQNSFLIDLDLPSAADLLLSGRADLVYGWSYDFLEARKHSDAITFVYPAEGTMIWCDNLTIPANAQHKLLAEQFINYLLRPEVSAEITNQIYVATPNDAARPFVNPALRDDPVIFPTQANLQNAELYFPLSSAAQATYDQIWQRFLQGR